MHAGSLNDLLACGSTVLGVERSGLFCMAIVWFLFLLIIRGWFSDLIWPNVVLLVILLRLLSICSELALLWNSGIGKSSRGLDLNKYVNIS